MAIQLAVGVPGARSLANPPLRHHERQCADEIAARLTSPLRDHSSVLLPAPRLSSPTVNCPDARSLARFYADLTGGEVTFANDEWAVVNSLNGRIDFQTVPSFSPPTWPHGDVPVGIHLDFWVADLQRPRSMRSRAAPHASPSSQTPSTVSCSVTRSVTHSA